MSEEEEKIFEDLVIKELHANNYFMFPENRNKEMHELIMDLACLYCMENYNKNYHYQLYED